MIGPNVNGDEVNRRASFISQYYNGSLFTALQKLCANTM